MTKRQTRLLSINGDFPYQRAMDIWPIIDLPNKYCASHPQYSFKSHIPVRVHTLNSWHSNTHKFVMRTVRENPYWRNESQFSNQDLNRQNYIPNHTTGHSVRTAITNVFRHKPSCKVMNAALSAYQWLMTQHSQWLYNHGVFYISVELLMLTQPVFALGLGGWLSHSGGGGEERPHFYSLMSFLFAHFTFHFSTTETWVLDDYAKVSYNLSKVF